MDYEIKASTKWLQKTRKLVLLAEEKDKTYGSNMLI